MTPYRKVNNPTIVLSSHFNTIVKHKYIISKKTHNYTKFCKILESLQIDVDSPPK